MIRMPFRSPNAEAEGTGDRRRFEIASTVEAIERVERILMEQMQAAGYNESAAFAVRLAFQEAANNARIHGNANDSNKRMIIVLNVTRDRIDIVVEDEGSGFDPVSVPDPTQDENLEIPTGRGLTLIRAFMSEAEIIPPGNRLRMSYIRPA